MQQPPPDEPPPPSNRRPPVGSQAPDAEQAPDTEVELFELEPTVHLAPGAPVNLEITLPSVSVLGKGGPITIPVPPPAAEPAVGTVLAGKYEIVELIASGGMGKVYRGRHTELRVPIAIKIMHGFVASQAEHVERFRREARAASRLNHPNVVRVLDFGQTTDTFYIVMEYVEGQSLGALLDELTEPLPLAEILPILLQILDALIQAHRQDVVHRDLKPDNVILTEDARGGRWVKLVDFGLARFQDPAENDATLTRADAVAGTPAYMSPEQCRSLRVGPSTDLYAFGCIMTELLQLMPPFSGASMVDTISLHLFAPVPPLTRPTSAEKVPPLLERLRLDLLAKNPAQRPADAMATRSRLLLAFDPDAEGNRQQERKEPSPAGARAARIPGWNSPQSESESELPTEALRVVHYRVPSVTQQLDQQFVTGLASLGVGLEVGSDPGVNPEGALAFLEGSDSLPETLAMLDELHRHYPKCQLLVGMQALSPEALRRLIEAGADDAIRLPTGPEVLGKKLVRLRRRQRT